MFPKLLLLFTLVPVIEFFLLIKVGQQIGTMNTIGLVIATGVLGAAFAKAQGLQILGKIQNTMAQGNLPGKELVQGVMVLVGAVLLVTPGFITDIVGLTLLFPLTRALYTKLFTSYFKKKFQSGKFQFTGHASSGGQYSSWTTMDEEEDGDIIDGHYTDVRDDPPLKKGSSN